MSGEAHLSAAQHHSYAVKAQRAWHWENYPPGAREQILERVRALIERNPNGYLAKHWREVYR